MAREIDHLVLPVSSLQDARERYEQLGFTVNADGIHPFGTANCCMFFENDTYLEPLAINDMVNVAEGLTAGNSFLIMDHNYRQTFGDEGCSGFALKTDDAERDRDLFIKAGMAERSIFAFERDARQPDGSVDRLSVAGSYCVEESFPGCSFFCVEWKGDKDSIARIRKAQPHQNGVKGVIGATLLAKMNETCRHFLETGLDTKLELTGDGSYLARLPGADIVVETDIGKIDYISDDLSDDQKVLSIASVTFEVEDCERLKFNLSNNRVSFEDREGEIIVPPARGQGVPFIFKSVLVDS